MFRHLNDLIPARWLYYALAAGFVLGYASYYFKHVWGGWRW